MPVHELAALAAATCWAVTGIVTPGRVRHLGPLAFNRIKLTFVTVALLLYVVPDSDRTMLTIAHVVPLALSGFVGIFLAIRPFT